MKRLRSGAITPYLCAPDVPIAEALRRLNASDHLFLLVVDGERRLLGTLTDGDVRRGLLRNLTLADPTGAYMFRDFAAGTAGDHAANQDMLRRHARQITFLPVLDPAGVVVEVLVRKADETGVVRALVMAGGFGRRLGARTKETPKPLLPIGERPILDHVLGQLEDAGVTQIHIAVHYRAEQIESFVAARASRAAISFIREEVPLGTAGALGLLPEPLGGPVMVVNGDLMTRVDFSAIREFHLRHGFDGTIGVTLYQVEVPFGVLKATEGGMFAGIEEKPTFRHVVAAGIYYLSPEIVALVPRSRPLDMPELLESARGVGLQIGLFPLHEYWRDIGQPADLKAAERDHRSDKVG